MDKKNDMNAKIRTILGEGTTVDGDFHSTSSARIDGTINGNINVDGTLVLGVKGRVNGDIQATAALIGGEVIGNIDASEKLEASSTARIIGNIRTQILVIDERAVFQGGCDMDQDSSASKKSAGKTGKATRAARKSARAAIEDALKDVDEDGTEELRMSGMASEQEPFSQTGSMQ